MYFLQAHFRPAVTVEPDELKNADGLCGECESN
ncbi:MAG: hypothetical protein CM1200mP2_19320 [Planctomycetaceae bacterium]|nr:MAG: hypothetical protein CM1200mP2_19320 [Planctomycetaceae bacterium]